MQWSDRHAVAVVGRAGRVGVSRRIDVSGIVIGAVAVHGRRGHGRAVIVIIIRPVDVVVPAPVIAPVRVLYDDLGRRGSAVEQAGAADGRDDQTLQKPFHRSTPWSMLILKTNEIFHYF